MLRAPVDYEHYESRTSAGDIDGYRALSGGHLNVGAGVAPWERFCPLPDARIGRDYGLSWWVSRPNAPRRAVNSGGDRRPPAVGAV